MVFGRKVHFGRDMDVVVFLIFLLTYLALQIIFEV